ncbi:MAG TPA: sigma-70 family RNA polymerase sigma factor [Terrimicrobiaceae bacterium]
MAPLREDPDIAAMSRLRDGDDLALNEIMDRWQRRLTSYLIRLTGNEAVALDLAQEVFVRVYQNCGRYRPTGAFATWLFTIATNLVRHHLRWKLRHPVVSLDDSSGHLPDAISEKILSSAELDPRTRLERDERAAAVREAVSHLPDDLREALVLFEYEEMSYDQVAKIQGCSAKAIETRLYRARAILRKRLERWLGST